MLWCRCTPMHSCVCSLYTYRIDDDHHDGFFLLRRDYNGFCIFFFVHFDLVSLYIVASSLPCFAYAHYYSALDASANIIPETRHGNTISIWLLHRRSGSIFVYAEWRQTRDGVSFMWFFFATYNHFIALLQYIHEMPKWNKKIK